MPVGDNDTLQMKLAHDPEFLNRVQYQIVKVARDVRAESAGTTGHALRNALAVSVLGNPAASAASFAVGLVTHINLTSEDTSYNTTTDHYETTATAGEVFSAVNDLWNTYAGV